MDRAKPPLHDFQATGRRKCIQLAEGTIRRPELQTLREGSTFKIIHSSIKAEKKSILKISTQTFTWFF